MKKRIVAALAAVLLFCGSQSCYAAETRASLYFDGYLLCVSAEGNGIMAVSFSVFGTGDMDQIGAYKIRVEEEIAKDTWATSFTAYGDTDPDTFYSYNAFAHTGSFTFYGFPGVTYRAVLTAYASNENGSEYSREITSTGRVCE